MAPRPTVATLLDEIPVHIKKNVKVNKSSALGRLKSALFIINFHNSPLFLMKVYRGLQKKSLGNLYFHWVQISSFWLACYYAKNSYAELKWYIKLYKEEEFVLPTDLKMFPA